MALRISAATWSKCFPTFGERNSWVTYRASTENLGEVSFGVGLRHVRTPCWHS